MRPVDAILARLQRAKCAGAGWRAACPSCGPDSRSLKLAVGESEDGRVLLHCFAGCEPAAVLAAIGLSLADLFDRPPATANSSPADRQQRRTEMDLAHLRAAAEALDLEACVLQVAAELLGAGRALAPEDRERLAVAHRRIDDTLARLRGARGHRRRAAR